MKKLLHIKNFPATKKNIPIELLLVKKEPKYLFVFSDSEPINKKKHYETIRYFVEEFVIQVFNKIKKENPQLTLEDFAWIQFLNLEEDPRYITPVKCLFYFPEKTEFDKEGFLTSIQLDVRHLTTEKEPPKSVEEVPYKLDDMFYCVPDSKKIFGE